MVNIVIKIGFIVCFEAKKDISKDIIATRRTTVDTKYKIFIPLKVYTFKKSLKNLKL